MANAALENGIFKLELESGRRADAAFRGKCSAEHRAAVRESFVAEPALNQFADREHVVERAFLVKHARAVDPGEGAQDHLIPVIPDFLDFPEYGSQNLVTHLLRHGN